MVFIVSVTYGLASNLELKNKGTTVCRRVFELWCFTAIIVTVIQYFVENYFLETIPLQYGTIYAYIISIVTTMVKATSIASKEISMQSKCLVNQKKK